MLIRDMRELHPKAVPVFAEWQRRCAAKSLLPFVLETRRARATGEAYYARGRQPLAVVNGLYIAAGLAPITAADNTRTITNAKWFETWHYPGCALDFAPLVKGVLDWVYSPMDASDVYDEIANEGAALGIISGRSFHDYGHIEWHPGITIDSLRAWAPSSPNSWQIPI
jgi:hypothetical protein